MGYTGVFEKHGELISPYSMSKAMSRRLLKTLSFHGIEASQRTRRHDEIILENVNFSEPVTKVI